MQEIVDGSKCDQDRNSPYNMKQTIDDENKENINWGIIN